MRSLLHRFVLSSFLVAASVLAPGVSWIWSCHSSVHNLAWIPVSLRIRTNLSVTMCKYQHLEQSPLCRGLLLIPRLISCSSLSFEHNRAILPRAPDMISLYHTLLVLFLLTHRSFSNDILLRWASVVNGSLYFPRPRLTILKHTDIYLYCYFSLWNVSQGFTFAR